MPSLISTENSCSIQNLTEKDSPENVVDFLVADTCVFLKNTRLDTISNSVFSPPSVKSEIQDCASRKNLETSITNINWKIPSTESIQAIVDFSKKTGDFSSLSVVDIQVLALTHMLEKQHNGSSHLRTEPLQKPASIASKGGSDPSRLVGFYHGGIGADGSYTRAGAKSQCELGEKSVAKEGEKVLNSEKETHFMFDLNDNHGWILPKPKLDASSAKSPLHPQPHASTSTHSSQSACGSPARVQVGCMTSDFSMQNVLLSMGLKVVSLEGKVIRKVKCFVLKCHACFQICKDTTRAFCPKCGNSTLVKTSVSYDDQGNITHFQNHFNKKLLNLRGTQYSIPNPQGGRNSHNLILREDQKEYTQRKSKSKSSLDVFDPNYVANTSPFAFIDIKKMSSAPVVGYGKRNPNERRRAKK